MNRRNVLLSGLCALAALVAGCTPLRGSRPDTIGPAQAGKSNNTTFDNPSGGPGGLVQAGGQQFADPGGSGKFDLAGGQPVSGFQAPPPPASQPLQTPRPATGVPIPPLPGAGGTADPNVRTDPTVYGGRLVLRPGETAADRVFDLTRQLETVFAQNNALAARIVELERLGAGREQALVEALREVEAAETEVAKTRGIISSQKSELALLQEKIRQMEREDIELLKLVISALEKALPRREP